MIDVDAMMKLEEMGKYKGKDKKEFLKLAEDVNRMLASKEAELIKTCLNKIKEDYTKSAYFSFVINVFIEKVLEKIIVDYADRYDLLRGPNLINTPSHRHSMKKNFLELLDRVAEDKLLEYTNSLNESMKEATSETRGK